MPKWNDQNGSHQYHPSYNVAPGSFTPVLVLGKLVESDSYLAIQPMRWGLVPSFVSADSAASFATSNARLESLLQKPSYSSSMRQGKRCVILAQGFYEWKTTNGRKQPYYIFPSDPKKMLMMAGVFAFHVQKQLFSYSIITTESVGPVADIHHRMPVILTVDDDVKAWLDSSALNPQQAQAFLTRIASELKLAPLSMYPVTQQMNSTKYDEPDCVVPLTEIADIKKPPKFAGVSNILINFLKRPKKLEDETQPAYKKALRNEPSSLADENNERKKVEPENQENY